MISPPRSSVAVRNSAQTDEADFARSLGLERSDLKQFCRFYNEKMFEYGNEVYSRVETRYTHWSNFRAGGWFQERLTPYLDSIGDVDVVVDLGFSVPYAYAAVESERLAGTRFLFVDRDPSVLQFYDASIRLLGLEHRRGIDRVLIADVEDAAGQRQIVEALGELSPRSTLIVASEVVEHLDDADVIWRLFEQLERIGNGESYVTLPVGDRIPSHRLEFLNEAAAEAYLRSHMSFGPGQGISTVSPPAGTTTLSCLQACVCGRGRAASSD